MDMNMIRSGWEDIFGKFSRAMAWLLSIVFVLVIMLQLAIGAGIIWLNSSAGQAAISQKITALGEQYGYVIDISKFGYSFPQGLRLEYISIADKNGPVAEVQNFLIRPALIRMGLRALEVSVNMDRLTLHRMPKSGADEAQEEGENGFSMQPFNLPELYFTRLALNDLSIERLELKEGVAGSAMMFSPRLTVGTTVQEDMTVNLRLDLKGAPSALPSHIHMFGRLNPQTLKGHLETLEIENPGYNLSAEGGFNLGPDGLWDIKAEGTVSNFSRFAEGVKGKASLSAALNGPLTSPAIMADAVVTMNMLQERGLEEIVLSLSDSDVTTAPLGRARIKTTYQGKPIELAAEFNLESEILSIRKVEGSAPDIEISGEVDIHTDSMLADGGVQLTVNDFTSYSTLADLTLAGQGQSDLSLQALNGKQSLDIDAVLTKVTYEDMALGSANISASIPDMTRLWPQAMTLEAQSLHIAKDLRIKTMQAQLSAQDGKDAYTLLLNANGRALQPFSIKGRTALAGIKTGQIKAQDMDFTLHTNESQATLKGHVNQETLDVVVTTDGLHLSTQALSLPEQVRQVVLSGQVSATGAMNAPVIQADLDASPLTILEGEEIILSVKGEYQDNNAQVDISGRGNALEQVNGDLRLPMRLSLYPFAFDLPSSTGLDGRVMMKADAGPLGVLFLPAGHRMGGALFIDGVLAGTLDAPDMRGEASIENGIYEYDAYGVGLYNMTIAAGLGSEGIQIRQLDAIDKKGGTLQASGVLGLTESQNTDIDLTLADFQVLGSDKAKGTFSAELGLYGHTQDYQLGGQIDIHTVSIAIPERFQSTIPTLNIVEKRDQDRNKPLLQVALDITVQAENKIFVRGWGLDAEFGGDINVAGTLETPLFKGIMEARRGRYEEFGRRFDLEQAYLRFQGEIPPSPYLDIIATTDASDIDASINLDGPVTKPSIALSSTPPLPQDEILSRVLFGENLQNITPFQAIQLKRTMDRFTGRGGGGFDALGKLRELAGVDDIRVDTDNEGQTTAGVGKYLTDTVYLELEKGAGDNSGAAKIQVEITPQIDLESEIGQDAQAGAGVLWKWDY